MQTVAQLPTFDRTAKNAGMSDAEVETLITFLAKNPGAGDLIEGTGGCRKFRYARPGMGKRGGYRVITFFAGEHIPVFLLAAYAKNQKVDLTNDERAAIHTVAKAIVAAYRNRPVRVVK